MQNKPASQRAAIMNEGQIYFSAYQIGWLIGLIYLSFFFFLFCPPPYPFNFNLSS